MAVGDVSIRARAAGSACGAFFEVICPAGRLMVVAAGVAVRFGPAGVEVDGCLVGVALAITVGEAAVFGVELAEQAARAVRPATVATSPIMRFIWASLVRGREP